MIMQYLNGPLSENDLVVFITIIHVISKRFFLPYFLVLGHRVGLVFVIQFGLNIGLKGCNFHGNMFFR